MTNYEKNFYLNRYESKIKAVLHSIFKKYTEELNDITQEGLIGFYLALDTVDPNKNLFSYCFQKAKWCCYNYLKKVQSFSVLYLEEMKSDNNFDPINGIHDIPNILNIETILIKELKKHNRHHQEILIKEIFGIKKRRSEKIITQKTQVKIKTNYKKKCLIKILG